MSAFSFNPDLDPEAIRRRLAVKGRLHIPSILSPDSAEAVGGALAGEKAWTRSVVAGTTTFHIPLVDDAPADPRQAEWLDQTRLDGLDSGVQYRFDQRRLGPSKKTGEMRGDLLDQFEAWLNAPEQIAYAQALTGEPRIRRCLAQGTRYLPGDVLTAHSDNDGDRRLYAYVLNLTRPWRTDWGGLLLFHDAEGHIEEGFTPAWNALNIFRVPMQHAVSQVASFAAGSRLSITGWWIS